MPRYDGTGPMGTGPIGRRMGPCYNSKAQNVTHQNFVGGGKMFRGGRFGKGFRKLYGMGYNRWLLAQEYGDPNRALYGCGPCGEAMYQASLKNQNKEKDNN